MSAKLGEILVRENLISPQNLREALDHQREHGGRLAFNLVKLGLVSDDMITAVLSRQYGIPSVNLELFSIDPGVLRLIPQDVAQKHSVLPLSRVGATLTLAMVDPTNVFALDEVKFMTGLNVEPVVVAEGSVQQAIAKYYGTSREIELASTAADDASSFERAAKNGANGNGSITHADLVSLDSIDFDNESSEDVEVVEDNEEIDLSTLSRMSEDAPVVRLVNVLLVDALRRGASDIHVEPYEKELRIRFRIDGLLYDVMHPPLKLRDALISRVKIMSKLDISEKRLPQDGRIKIKVKVDSRSRELDFRVSTLPTLFGEKVVLRLLDKQNLMLDMTRLGFEPASLKRFQRNISKPYGMVLVTGPTGSGKTNTLYSALQSLNTVDTNIMTAEDPVEFNLMGINQVQMKEQIGLNFAAALRSFLRQDPNIILVGEIRDFETAEITIIAVICLETALFYFTSCIRCYDCHAILHSNQSATPKMMFRIEIQFKLTFTRIRDDDGLSLCAAGSIQRLFG
jgi:type IV pilus assembly protein PilB